MIINTLLSPSSSSSTFFSTLHILFPTFDPPCSLLPLFLSVIFQLSCSPLLFHINVNEPGPCFLFSFFLTLTQGERARAQWTLISNHGPCTHCQDSSSFSQERRKMCCSKVGLHERKPGHGTFDSSNNKVICASTHIVYTK